MKKIVLGNLIVLQLLFLFSCQKQIPEFPSNDFSAFQYKTTSMIPIADLVVPYSDYQGYLEAFRSYQKPEDEFALILTKSSIKTHQIIFEFAATYPLEKLYLTTNQTEKIHQIKEISVDISLDGYQFDRIINKRPLSEGKNEIPLDNHLGKKVKLTFLADNNPYLLQDVRFSLGEGFVIIERLDWSNQFLRYSGWAGADGIFSFNLDGPRQLWDESVNQSLFIFSDTVIGDVYQHNNLRKQTNIINNSFAYFDHQKPFQEALDFVYVNQGGHYESVFQPGSYLGKNVRNLFDSDGLTPSFSLKGLLTNNSDGTMFLHEGNQSEFTLDFGTNIAFASVALWNYNEAVQWGTKDVSIKYSNNLADWTELDSFTLPKARGNNLEPVTLIQPLIVEARYLRIKLNGYEDDYVGLGKMLFFNDEAIPVFGQVMDADVSQHLTPLDQTARLWLQDGFVVNNHLYVYALLVKDTIDLFKVHSVVLIETPIVNGKLRYEQATYLNTPLFVNTATGGESFFGAGTMDLSEKDGYLYLYGYLDLNGRHLIVSRFLPENITNFNTYEYFNGESWVNDIHQVSGLKDRVSAELSVTYIPEGYYQGKYMLVVIENTMTGIISYALGDSPVGPFGNYQRIYLAGEHRYLDGAFAYNAKMHPHLSEKNHFLISYNVNTSKISALKDVRIYYPRFIEMIEIEKEG